AVRIPGGAGGGRVSGRREVGIGKRRGTGCGGSIDFADRGGESEISQPRPIKCSRNRGAFRGGREIGGGGIAPMRRSIGSGDRIVRQRDWRWRAHLLRGRRNEWQARCS